jgi:adenylate cyclase
MSEIILQNQGIVDKYIGDAIMAFWNARKDFSVTIAISVKDHATVACSVALKQKQKLMFLRKRWKEMGYPDVDIRIGINTGNALVGNLGSTFRLSYTCLGDTVNLASRLESLGKRYGVGIIISQYTFESIHKEYFITRPLDVVRVKGKVKSVKIYELIGFKKLMQQDDIFCFSLYDRAFESFYNGNYIIAQKGFQIFLKSHPNDKAAKYFLELCAKYITEPPPSGWKYVVILDEK